MATLILADARTVDRHNVVSLLENRPGFVIMAAVANADDARTQVLAHRPDVVVLAGAGLHSDMCAAVAEVATTEVNARVVFVLPYEGSPAAATPRPTGVSAILTRQNSFEDILTTMMVVLHGGIFMTRPSTTDPAAQAKLHGLSRREHEVLKGISAGRTTKVMARTMDVSPKTVETYRNRLMQKLRVRCAADLIRFAVTNGLA